MSPPAAVSTLIPALAAISSCAYSKVIGGYFFLSELIENNHTYDRLQTYQSPFPLGSERPRAVLIQTPVGHCDELQPKNLKNNLL